MAASVRVEDEAFSDTRYQVLAREAGLADADHALGKMIRIWRQCTLEQRHVLPVADVESVLGSRAVEALELSRLGHAARGGVRIKGTKGRIEWLQTLRANGRKGGRPRKPEGLASGSAHQNPPAPAPAPVPVQLNTEEFRAVWDRWITHRSEIRCPLKPSQEKAQLRKLAREGERSAIERIERSILNGWRGLWFKGDDKPAPARFKSKAQETTDIATKSLFTAIGENSCQSLPNMALPS